MPICFQLLRKGTETAMKLVDVDSEMREKLGKPADKENWLANWYNRIGFRLAAGDTFDQLIEDLDEDNWDLREVIDYLAAEFDVDHWRE